MASFAVVVCLVLALGNAHGFLFGGPDWDGLKVTWGINPLSSYTFAGMPRTKSDAINKNWVQLSAFSGTGNCGERYYKDNDLAVVLIYDRNGFIAGIQSGIPDDLGNGYPSNKINHFFQHDAARSTNFITAYFVDPQIVCGRGRTQDEYDDEGTGTMLGVQNGATTFDILNIPMSESDMAAGTEFTHGHCFWTMGEHYWASTDGPIASNLACDSFYPMFMLYNGGKLNGFGWAFLGNAESPRFEHPDKSSLDKFLPTPVPDCLYNQPHFTTIHIYVDNSPSMNFC